MDNSTFRLATYADVDLMIETVRSSTREMLNIGIDQWHYDYPTVHHLEKDIAHKSAVVGIIDSKLVSISYEISHKVKYPKVNWIGLGEEACYIHRLVIHPALQGQGLAQKLYYEIEKLSIDKGVRYMRLDSYRLNPQANKLYDRLGFSMRKEVFYFHNNKSPFNLYEKVLF